MYAGILWPFNQHVTVNPAVSHGCIDGPRALTAVTRQVVPSS